MKQFKVIWMVTIVVTMVMGQVGWAQDKAVVKPLSAEQVMELAKPYISSTTLAVAYADAKRVDFVGLATWVNQLVPKLNFPREMTEDNEFKTGFLMGPIMVEGMRSGFVAIGGRHILFVFNVPDTFREPTPLIIFPVEKGGNAGAILAMLRMPTLNNKMKANKVCVVLHQDAVLFGNAQDLRQIVAGKYQTDSRPQLLTAFKAVEDQQIQIVFNPYKDLRRVIDELMPNLPAQLGSEPTSTFTHGLAWTSMSLTLSAKPEVKLINQSDSQTDAMALYRFLNRLPKLIEPNMHPNEMFLLDWLKQGIALVPEPAAGVMQTTVTTTQIEKSLIGAASSMAKAWIQGRRKVLLSVTGARIRGLFQVCYTYTTQHKNQWPDSLKQAVEGEPLGYKLLFNPRAIAKSRSYIYRKPTAEQLKNATTSIIIYEEYDAWPANGITVGFADGHVEFIATEKAFKKRLGSKAKNDEQELGKVKIKTSALTKTRATALRTKAMVQVRDLATACIVYTNKNKNQWPTSLEQAVKGQKNADKLLVNSRAISKSRGFIYRKPTAEQIKNSSTSIVIYEAYDTWPTDGISAGFVDGHSEFYRTEKAFKKRLGSKAKARDEALKTQAGYQINQLQQLCYNYSVGHKNQWPGSLEQAVEGHKDARKLLVNPRAISKSRGYIYRKPTAEQIKNTAAVITIYEEYDTWPTGGINAGYIDGHVENFYYEKDFKKHLGPKAKKK